MDDAFEKLMEVEIEDAEDDIRRKGTKSVVTTNYRKGYLRGLQQALDNYQWLMIVTNSPDKEG